ncbi:MAG: trypsin-like serine protease [Bacteroidaceae bacterium]|nr:trypsin-like serine protease [Bacteroidaceae bacterium]
MEFTKYIVPIYVHDEFNGNGFIVGNKLITAAHVVISKENECYFLYEGGRIIINSSNNLLFEYPDNKNMQGYKNNYWDIAIYILENIDSSLELREPQLANTCFYKGYSNTDQIDSYDNIYLENKDLYNSPQLEKPIPITNTYVVFNGHCREGNSGGPLFQGICVVGMLVGNQQYSRFSLDRYIKSNYIVQRIKSL